MFYIELYRDGILRIIAKNKNTESNNQKSDYQIIWNSTNIEYAGIISDNYIARLESNGNLIVYKDISTSHICQGIVWMSDPDNLPTRCKNIDVNAAISYTNRNIRKLQCNMFPKSINALLSKNELITIIISTMNRYDILYQQLLYYSKSNIVKTIIVTWHNTLRRPPRSTIINNVPIHFIPQQYDSLNNRFNPNIQITTNAVLIIDDDMKIHLQDLRLLYTVWKQYPNNIIGFSLRWFYIDNMNATVSKGTEDDEISGKSYMRYSSKAHDPEQIGTTDVEPQKGYGLILTKVMMLHRKYLYDYSCSNINDVLIQEYHNMVDTYNNCEDIGMNGIVAHMTYNILSAPPLFVQPSYKIADYGGLQDSTSLHYSHGVNSWERVRSQCLNKINYFYYTKHGTSLPVQDRILYSSVIKSTKNVEIKVTEYNGYQTKIIVECKSNDTETETSSVCSPNWTNGYYAKDKSVDFVWKNLIADNVSRIRN
jgi:hypothetical protein